LETSNDDKKGKHDKRLEASIYCDKDDPNWKKHLFQGDILDPTLLKNNLEGHQDYFHRNHFVRYMVLTQTCDLVLDKTADRPRFPVDFIQLAVVRRMRDVFGKKHVENKKKRRSTLNQLWKILGHQSDRRGLFYLPTEEQHGILEPCVVDLRVTFSLYKIHYDDIKHARCGGLRDLYAAQLGQMIAYMFSRVAMPDTKEEQINDALNDIVEREKKRFQELVASLSVKQCMISDCPGKCDTYRWLKVGPIGDDKEFEEIVLCHKHAAMHDSGVLMSNGCIIRFDESMVNQSN
jgi:hypothetical protein